MPSARSTDPDTSHEAADDVLSLTERRKAILATLSAHGPLTDAELAFAYGVGTRIMGFPRQSESGLRTRRSELAKAGLVIQSGHAVNESGRRVTVWASADQPVVPTPSQLENAERLRARMSGGSSPIEANLRSDLNAASIKLHSIHAHADRWLAEPRRSVYTRTKDVIKILESFRELATRG